MLLDAQFLFSDAQTTTTSTDTGLTSTNVVDLLLAGRRIGTGKPLYVVSFVTTTFTSAGSNDPLAVNLITDSVAAMSSAAVVQRLYVLPAVAAAGYKAVGVIAPKDRALERYLAVQYLSTGDGALTAGAVTTFLTETPDEVEYYADGFTIS